VPFSIKVLAWVKWFTIAIELHSLLLLEKNNNGSSIGGVFMLHSRAPKVYFWIILWVVLAFLLLIAEAALFPQPVIAMVNQIKEILNLFVLQVSQFIQ
jgi:NAD-reducing hydrogenase small subunit